MNKSVKQLIIELLSLSANLNNIKTEDKLTDLGLDSLDIIEVVMDVERELDIKIQDSKVEKFNTVQDFIDEAVKLYKK